MALPHDLLAQAKFLATKEPKKPKQASLRRATSSAYYALFHLLIAEGAKLFATGNQKLLRARVQRAFVHGDMKAVCKQFATNAVVPTTAALLSPPVQPALALVARTFVTAQENRHEADYDTAKAVIRLDVLTNINAVEQAFNAWATVRASPNAKVFLAAMLLQKQWGRG